MKFVIKTTCFLFLLLFINFFEVVYEKYGSARASETVILEIMVQGAKRIDPETIIDGIFRSYDVIWDFRYLLRDDFNALLNPEDDVLVTVQGVNDVLDYWTEGRMLHAANHGLLAFDKDDSGAVAEIILVLGRYWMDFSHKKYPTAEGVALRHKGLSHIFTVLRPYLSTPAFELIEERLRRG